MLFFLACLLAQSAPEPTVTSYTVYNDHPRLFLRPARLRLLKRERERKSLRWEQFNLLASGQAPWPEPGLANALYYQIAGDREAGRRAVTWALSQEARDLHQISIVFDWCQDLLTEAENRAFTVKLERAFQGSAGQASGSLDRVRDRLFAAIVLGREPPIQQFVEKDWKGRMDALHAGRNAIPREEMFALYEILHAVRDNLTADLRDDYPKYFKQLPIYHLLSYYPAPFPAAESEYRIPAAKNMDEPNLQQAALSRAAELAMVAFDANAPESQVLQGWLMNDRFLMRGTFGMPYEFLWANPYQPGLSYYHVPMVFHDEILGRLFVRSSWEDDATWAGFFDSQLQLFRDGKVSVLSPEISREPLDLEEATLFFGREVHKFQLPAKAVNDAFIVGLEPKRTYDVEIDDEELWEVESDPGGILYFPGLRGNIGLRFKQESSSSKPASIGSSAPGDR